MPLLSLTEFIDTSLFENGSFVLSYKDPLQKWMIRNHILRLLQEFPFLIPSTNTLVHFDGTTMNLLNISGFLHVSDFLPEVPLTIWIHENYPLMSPMIFIPLNPECPISEDHPYIDQSGAVTPPYILNWDSERSNLCELVRSLIRLFQLDHPSMPSTMKESILNELFAKICDDLVAMDVTNQYEIERLSNDHIELQEQSAVLDEIIKYEGKERDELQKSVVELRDYNDKLSNWLRKNKNAASLSMGHCLDEHKKFDKKSKIFDCLVEAKALDDVICALDKALEQGVISLDMYMRQVRGLAREQFHHKAMRLKLRTTPS